MLKAIHFRNFKCLRDTSLSLEPFTLLIGPNGSGKSTALFCLDLVRSLYHRGAANLFGVTVDSRHPELLRTIGAASESAIDVSFERDDGERFRLFWAGSANQAIVLEAKPGPPSSFAKLVSSGRIFTLSAHALAQDAELSPHADLGSRGEGLVAVIDRLRDSHPERFEALNAELARCVPEFDRILFETPQTGKRRLRLRLADQPAASIPAHDLSQGTLLALGLLTLAYLPDPPPIIGLEEPDHGLHPRLLRDVRDALYRLAYPKDYGEDRQPIQVIATTHSPVFLDLFRDHPEQVVIAEKHGLEARFRRLTECEYLDEILESTPLGEAWYTGVLGGVPEKR